MARRLIPEDSRTLSQLLDLVVGTPEMIDIRQDYCRLRDCMGSEWRQDNVYFTGSKAEGLELPGSDEDYMFDVNNRHCVKVIQSLDENPYISPLCIFVMCTDNTHPGFALLQLVSNVHQTMIKPHIYKSLQNRNGSHYLNSDVFVNGHSVHTLSTDIEGETFKRQGPSLEFWDKFADKSDSGRDTVLSIHCAFWPNEAAEWTNRVRNFCWPTQADISSIIEFGFHLVPVGHPHSIVNSIEWRISFSMAERVLVWSFNHTQMQCYALMKILLKEFIKVKCNPQNQVLCSYFIKTFLFWKYETTELNFWREDNLRECIKLLMSEFSQCIKDGVLRHYFIPRFNLLSVKLTRAAQIELLQLIDIIIESDISILKECRTLQNTWSEFLQVYQNRNNVVCNQNKRIMCINEKCMMENIEKLESFTNTMISSKILDTFCKTPIKAIVLRKCIFTYVKSILMDHCGSENKDMYQIYRTAQNETLSADISTCKLWCAILLYMRRDFSSTLSIINQFLSDIPPYAIYLRKYKFVARNEDIELYVSMLQDSNTSIIERAKKAWMFPMSFRKNMSDSLPLGLNILLYFSDGGINLSPFICAYYLQFLCYHQMHQYANRDCVLKQLIELEKNPKQLKFKITDINIIGHCLLLAGQRALARYTFYRSYTETQSRPPEDKYNSAIWYLQNCF